MGPHLLHNTLMNILQKIFKEHYEIEYILHTCPVVMETSIVSLTVDFPLLVKPYMAVLIVGRLETWLSITLPIALYAYFSLMQTVCANPLVSKNLWDPCTVWHKTGTRLEQKISCLNKKLLFGICKTGD